MFYIGKFLRGALKQLGAVRRAKKQEWDENSIRVIYVAENGIIDTEMAGERKAGGLVMLHQIQKTVEIRREYRDIANRPTIIQFQGSFRSEDIEQTFDINRAHDGEPMYLDMRDYEEVTYKTSKKEKDGTTTVVSGTKMQPAGGVIRVFPHSTVTEMVYRVMSARVNNMFQEPSFNFTILMSAAAFVGGLMCGAVMYALFLV
jgi:hypothetical protein